jgi:hypothetical protein
MIGDVWDDLGKALTHPADTVSGALDIVVHPEDDFNALVQKGPDTLGKAIGQTWSRAGDVADWATHGMAEFARSGPGKTLLDIAAGAAFMAISISPYAPLAYLIFAVPGLMRGDNFSTAWLHGMFDQGIRIAKGVSGGDINIDLPPEVTDQIQQATTAFATQTGAASQFLEDNGAALEAAGLPSLDRLDYVQLAAKLGIREDAAAEALANARNNVDELTDLHQKEAAGFFDPVTGRARLSRAARINSAQSMIALQAIAKGAAKTAFGPTMAQQAANSGHSVSAVVARINGPAQIPFGATADKVAAAPEAFAVADISHTSTGTIAAAAAVVVVALSLGAAWSFKWRRK